MKFENFDIKPFYAEALAHAYNIRDDIDDIYFPKKEEFYIAAINSQYYTCGMCTENSLLTEIYFKKILGIIEYVDMNQDKDIKNKIYSLFKKAYKKTFLYFKNKDIKNCDMLLYLNEMSSYFITLNDDKINGHVAAAIFFTDGLCKNMDEIIDMMSLRWQHYNGHKKLSLYNASDEEKKIITNLYKYCGKHVLKKEVLSSEDSTYPQIDFIYDIEKISSLSIFNELDFGRKDIEEIILTYIAGEQISKKQIELEDYIIFGLHIKALCKAYKKVKEMYFQNNKETMYTKISALKKILTDTKTELNNQVSENKKLIENENRKIISLEEENTTLQREIYKLKEQIKEYQSNLKEVIALREYIFRQKQEVLDDEDDIDEIDVKNINNKKGIIIGGHEKWQNKIKEYLPNWTMIKRGVNTLDTKIIEGSEIIIFNTSNLNHSLYYKIIDIIRNNDTKIGYVSYTNINNAIKEIKKYL